MFRVIYIPQAAETLHSHLRAADDALRCRVPLVGAGWHFGPRDDCDPGAT